MVQCNTYKSGLPSNIQRYLNMLFVAEIKDYRTRNMPLGNRTGATWYQQITFKRNHTFSSL